MKANTFVIKWRRKLNSALLTISSLLLVFLMILGFGDVFARYFFSSSIVQREELFRVALIMIFATSFPVITMRHEHLDVDLLDGLFVGSLKKIQFFFVDIFVATSCATMSYWMWDKAERISRTGREVMFEELKIQQGYFCQFFSIVLAVVSVIMVCLALLHIVSIFVKNLDDDIAEIRHRLTL